MIEAVEQFSAMPYLATLLNCAMLIVYGLLHNNVMVTINICGLLLEGAYLYIFIAFSPRRWQLKILGILALEVGLVGGFLALVFGVVPHSQRTEYVGIACIISSIIMYALPLSTMKTVIQTKSVKYMPFFLSFISFLDGIFGILGSLLRFDIYILIPSFIGAFFSGAQLILYYMYRDEPEQSLELQVFTGTGPTASLQATTGTGPTAPPQATNPTAEAQATGPTAEAQATDPTAEAQDTDPTAEAQDTDPTAEAQDTDPTAEAQDTDPTTEVQDTDAAEAHATGPTAEAQVTGTTAEAQATGTTAEAQATGTTAEAQATGTTAEAQATDPTAEALTTATSDQ